jgi:hypothetical protein
MKCTPAPLPAGALQHPSDRGLQAGVGVGDDQLHPAQPTRPQRPQERRPEGLVLAVADRDAQDLPVAGQGHAGGDDHRLGHDPPAGADLDVGRVAEQVGEGDVVQRPVAEGRQALVELGADAADLAAADAGLDAQGFDHVIDAAGGHPLDIDLHHHRQQRPIDPPARLQQRGEERPLPQLGDRQLDVAGLGRQQPLAAAVAVRRASVGALVAAGADDLLGLGVNQGLQHHLHRHADHIDLTAGANPVEQLGQGRLIKGHRTNLFLRVGLGHAEDQPVALLHPGTPTQPKPHQFPGRLLRRSGETPRYVSVIRGERGCNRSLVVSR